MPGFPIRTSPDQSSLSSSPMLFAANHVLHRLLPPRHPPSALCSLTINQIGQVESVAIGRGGQSKPWVPFGTLRLVNTYILHARRSQLGKIFSYQRSTDRDDRGHQLVCAGRGHQKVRRANPCLEVELHSEERGQCGGAGRDRTDDLRLAKPALSQLSYSPR